MRAKVPNLKKAVEKNCNINELDKKLIEFFWPGPLTMVLPAKGPIIDALNPGKANIGIRVPDCPMTKDLISRSGALATTSANLAGHRASLDATQASAIFPDLPLLGPIPWP